MYGYIYKRTNLLNNLSYIGQHKFDKNEIDQKYRGSGTYLKHALKKYGEENFSYEIIDTADSCEDLDEKEIYWIKECGTLFPSGYNICKGGHKFHINPILLHEFAVAGNKARGRGWHQSEHQKQVVREYMRSRLITKEFREKCSRSKIGNTNGRGNTGMIWITVGGQSRKVHSLDDITEEFVLGRSLSSETLSKYKESYKDRIYVHKDSVDKYIKIKELDMYLQNGFVVGRCHDSYVNRGDSISKGKKGCIKIQNSDGKIKYIKPELLDAYIEEGYSRTSKKNTV